MSRPIYLVPIEVDEDLSSFKIRTELDSVAMVLRFDWNEREERWSMTIYDADETTLVAGLPLHVNLELIGRFEIDGLPLGGLMLYDASGQNEECGRDDLGDRCLLLYESSEEVA